MADSSSSDSSDEGKVETGVVILHYFGGYDRVPKFGRVLEFEKVRITYTGADLDKKKLRKRLRKKLREKNDVLAELYTIQELISLGYRIVTVSRSDGGENSDTRITTRVFFVQE
jgi:hypothetical protein